MSASGKTWVAGHLPVAARHHVTLGDRRISIVGGYTTSVPLRSVLEFRPGHQIRDVATLPHPVRYAAAAAVLEAR